ncbi:MAG TPA: hypothetical protein PL105_16110, partial [Caldilineaceae bacterium]|nr:hypothetical protein [Caldilineaceae bacterium]
TNSPTYNIFVVTGVSRLYGLPCKKSPARTVQASLCKAIQVTKFVKCRGLFVLRGATRRAKNFPGLT